MDRPPKPPFNLLRAVFYLLAFVIVAQVVGTVLAGILCWWTNITGQKIVGACFPLDQLIKQVWEEILTTVLALLVAGRPPPP